MIEKELCAFKREYGVCGCTMQVINIQTFEYGGIPYQVIMFTCPRCYAYKLKYSGLCGGFDLG